MQKSERGDLSGKAAGDRQQVAGENKEICRAVIRRGILGMRRDVFASYADYLQKNSENVTTRSSRYVCTNPISAATAKNHIPRSERKSNVFNNISSNAIAPRFAPPKSLREAHPDFGTPGIFKGRNP